MFFVYCGSNFDGRKDLTFYLFRVNIPPIANSPSKMSCSGSIFTTTSHPTVIFGTHGNSGDKRAENDVFPSGKGRKCPEMSGHQYSQILWDVDAAGSNPVTPTKILTEFRGFTSTFGQFFMFFRCFAATFKKIAFFYDHIIKCGLQNSFFFDYCGSNFDIIK